MNAILYVAFGGAIGAAARYLTTEWAGRRFGEFPYGTMIVNIVGSLLMGLVIGWLMTKAAGSDSLKLFLATGVLGGFTTFSAFSLDAMNLLEEKSYSGFAAYVGGSVLLAIIALMIGLVLARKVFG
ncbi:MAG: fluoride efflux transporter CrcB [Hellea sp.]|nr:fluoride efflux transporter CrcB [Hellea sp.]